MQLKKSLFPKLFLKLSWPLGRPEKWYRFQKLVGCVRNVCCCDGPGKLFQLKKKSGTTATVSRHHQRVEFWELLDPVVCT